jgi:hypothetical protein
VVSLVGRIALDFIKMGAKSVVKPAPPLQQPETDLTTILGEGSGAYALSADQAGQIAQFLDEPAVRCLQQLRMLARVLPGAEHATVRAVATPEAFGAMAAEWCAARAQNWHGIADSIWTQIENEQEAVFSRLLVNGMPDETFDPLTHRFFFGTTGTATDPPDYLIRIGDIAKDRARQVRITRFVDECVRPLDLPDAGKFRVQGLDATMEEFSKLYVDRNLSDAVTREVTTASDELDIARMRPRTVIVGDPGVGKTTLTAWMKWTYRQSEVPAPIMATVISRQHLIHEGASLMEAIRVSLDTEFLISVDDDCIRDLLSVGWLAVLVDGLDEILDQSKRRLIVNQLHALASRYPFAAIVCTTRRTGFEVSLFRTETFKVLNLDEYTEDQVEEYANRWFQRFPDEGMRAPRFLGESRTLTELRRNPLMLSLLCALYRRNDYIPRSRRDVYLRCAGLMFYEWDPQRGIAIPHLFKNEGEAILRDIALLLKQAGGISMTLDGQQLEKLISSHLESKGEQPVVAMASAKELLRHCSDRAWILSRVGGGERYSFTHRTFYEFFAAEAIVRKVNRENEFGTRRESPQGMRSITTEILSAYLDDRTSVMPELLLQSGDDLMGGISSVVIQELRSEAVHGRGSQRPPLIGLAVRLIASAGVN